MDRGERPAPGKVAGGTRAPDAFARGLLVRAAPRLELLVVPAVLLIAWAVTPGLLGTTAAAGPSDTLRAVVDGFQAGWLGEALGETLVGTALSFVIAAALGLTLGFFMGLSRFWGRVLDAPLIWLYALPKITLYPIFLLLLGLTLQARVGFAVLHGFIPLALFTVNGMRTIPPVYFKVARVYRLSRWQVIRRIVLPSSLPAIVVGMRYCFSLTFIGLIFAEMFAAREGTGYELIQAISLHRVPETFGIALVLILIALAVNAAFTMAAGAVERQRGQALPRRAILGRIG